MSITPTALSDIVLTTQNLLLRELEESDAKAVHEFASDLEVIAHSPWGPYDLEQAKQWLVQMG